VTRARARRALAAGLAAALAACVGGERSASDSVLARDSTRDTTTPAIAPAPIPPVNPLVGRDSASTPPVHGRDSVADINPGDPRRQIHTVPPRDTGRRPPP
jgi:hypothetical protein